MKKMGLPKAKIIGHGYYVPDTRLTNEDLERMVETSDEWIVRRTGISERRIASKEIYTSDLAYEAAKRAIENANIDPSELDLVLVATTTPDMYTPNVACMIQNKLGISGAAFDVNSACTGFMTALTVATQFIASGYYKKILLIGAENLSRMTDYKDRNTCILFGDGAGAVVLEASQDGGVLDTYIGADGASGTKLTSLAFKEDQAEVEKRVSGMKNTIWMDGSEVLKFAVRTMAEATKVVLEKAGLTLDDIKLVIPHQANIRIVEGAAKRLGIGDDKLFVNLQNYGNMAAASIPVALCEAIDQGRIVKGDKFVMVGFGGGLTWGAAVVEL